LPRLSFFYGIAIYLYYADENPSHFHPRYGEHEARIVIATGEVLSGSLPRRALRLIGEWTEEHRDDLLACWNRAVAGEAPGTIEPLR
jgi:Domain of unknown function (DUF4160)